MKIEKDDVIFGIIQAIFLIGFSAIAIGYFILTNF